MSLKNLAQQTLQLLEEGGFRGADGAWVDLAEAQRAAVAGTFTLIQIFIDDLANPFGGIWSVEPARRKIIELSKSLDQDALDVGEAEEAA